MKKLWLGVLFLFSTVACAEEQGAWRDYTSVFEGIPLTEEQKSKIKLFDVFAFGSQESKYNSIEVDKKQNRLFRVLITDDYLTRDPVFSLNFRILYTYTFGELFYRTDIAGDSSVAVVLVDELQPNKIQEVVRPSDSFLTEFEIGSLLDEIKIVSSTTCGIWQKTDNHIIEKTLILVERPTIPDWSMAQKRAAISCINRGHYYHLGFSNSLELPAEYFVRKHPDLPKFYPNPNTMPILPLELRNGAYAGQSRYQVLRAITKLIGQ